MSEGAGQHRLVFGLSADPIHVGHVEMVAQSATALIALGYCLTEVLLIPVYRRNPVGVRKDRLPQTYPQRLEMCRLAAAEVAERLFRRDVGVRACTIEADLARESELPNYTADTLSALRAEGEAGLIFLVGSELVSGPDPQLSRWHRPDDILALATLAICPRLGYLPNEAYLASLAAEGADIVVLKEATPPEISATEIRDRLRDGAAALSLVDEGLLTPAVARYLTTHPLYAA